LEETADRPSGTLIRTVSEKVFPVKKKRGPSSRKRKKSGSGHAGFAFHVGKMFLLVAFYFPESGKRLHMSRPFYLSPLITHRIKKENPFRGSGTAFAKQYREGSV
jgi:hypothetical protein